ncbi:hypothetical protein [Clostridium sp.]|uniref:hypothetical protein n=1 Tax=Clostridium sp. TaxID=1506 RepID=UPI002849C81E|nr:hypothetical protein [Clostridium sp.]MDR3593815.1 hypothetical protein [Clostridium sp.]
MPFIKSFLSAKRIDFLNILYAGNGKLVLGGDEKMKSFVIQFKANETKEEILKKINVAIKSKSL